MRAVSGRTAGESRAGAVVVIDKRHDRSMGCRPGSRIRKSIIATISPKRPHDGEHRSESRAERRLRCAVFLSAAVRSEPRESLPRESLRPPVGGSARVAQAGVCGTKMESVPTLRGELEASRAVAQALVERLGVESSKTAFSAWKIPGFPYPSKGNSAPQNYLCIPLSTLKCNTGGRQSLSSGRSAWLVSQGAPAAAKNPPGPTPGLAGAARLAAAPAQLFGSLRPCARTPTAPGRVTLERGRSPGQRPLENFRGSPVAQRLARPVVEQVLHAVRWSPACGRLVLANQPVRVLVQAALPVRLREEEQRVPRQPPCGPRTLCRCPLCPRTPCTAPGACASLRPFPRPSCRRAGPAT